jgi:NAD(P)-dependent dehydrogenase (short-subunit alcohol dehydrogenase family)
MMTAPRGPVLVTGTSSGIGKAIALRLLADGRRVVGAARRTAGIDHPGYREVLANLGTAEGCVAAATAAAGATGFVHAAGFMAAADIGTLDASAGEEMWALHVAAAERLASALAPAMAPGGRIILIGSRAASGVAGRSQYAATKSALVALARSWAIELAARGVTVNVVAPAATDTPMLADPRRAGNAPKLPPIGRYIRPEEVAATVAFLTSDEASAITGQTITICGGASL